MILLKDRIKAIRKYLGITQQEMADRIGIKRNTIANYEIGRNVPIDAVISLICREFGVNEVWLRTGEGGDDNMFAKVTEDDRYAINLGKLTITENQIAKNMLNAIAEASPEKLKHIEEFMKACLGIE
ncbi:MAG: helix-turn-helix transcriptional regulator [Clostridium sp.]|nr:helix-turn-helix transcriptional regulator [Clostridium sp.]